MEIENIIIIITKILIKMKIIMSLGPICNNNGVERLK